MYCSWAYAHQPRELQSGRNIFGHKVRRVISLPSSATANTQFAVFGNLQYRWVGYRPGFIIDLLRELTEDIDGDIWAACAGKTLNLLRVRGFDVRDRYPAPQ